MCLRLSYLTDAVAASGTNISWVGGGGGGARIGGRCNAARDNSYATATSVGSVNECRKEGVKIVSAAPATHPPASSYDECVTPTTQEFNLQGTIFFSLPGNVKKSRGRRTNLIKGRQGRDSIGLICRPNHRPKHRPDGFYTGNAPRNAPPS